MRLSELETAALGENIPWPVFLCGSRLDDKKRGGDIDLLILAERLTAKERFQVALDITVAFRKMCDQKIDVTVFSKDHLSREDDLFLNSLVLEQLRLP